MWQGSPSLLAHAKERGGASLPDYGRLELLYDDIVIALL